MIVEILSPNLSSEQKPLRMQPRFVYWGAGVAVSDPTSYPEALAGALALGDDGSIGFIADDPAPAPATDWSKPLPAILSRRKSNHVNVTNK